MMVDFSCSFASLAMMLTATFALATAAPRLAKRNRDGLLLRATGVHQFADVITSDLGGRAFFKRHGLARYPRFMPLRR